MKKYATAMLFVLLLLPLANEQLTTLKCLYDGMDEKQFVQYELNDIYSMKKYEKVPMKRVLWEGEIQDLVY